MGSFDTCIRHDGGTEFVHAQSNRDGTVTIRFGASYTLRIDGMNLDKMRDLLHYVSCDLMYRDDDLPEPGQTFEIPEKDFIRPVNQSRDEL